MIEIVPQTGSTNADLSARLRGDERVVEGHWLIADRQTAGRGRQGRPWSDGKGNFMGSTTVRPHERDPAPHTLTFVAALALYETVVPLIPNPGDLRLKWPNDLLLGGAKLAGILLEREGAAIIIGIGVNLASAPEIEAYPTVALSQFGPSPDRDHFARALAKAFDQEVDRWRTFGLAPILRRWEAIAYPAGTALTITPPGEDAVNGSFGGLSDDGALLLRLENGALRAIHAGDVVLAQKER